MRRIEILLKMMFRDAPELRQLLAKESVAIPTGVCVAVADDVDVGVGEGQIAVPPLFLLDVLVGRIPRAEDNAGYAA